MVEEAETPTMCRACFTSLSSNTTPFGKHGTAPFLPPRCIHPASCCIAAILAAAVGDYLTIRSFVAQPLYFLLLEATSAGQEGFGVPFLRIHCWLSSPLGLAFGSYLQANLSRLAFVEPLLPNPRSLHRSHSLLASLSWSTTS